MRHTTRRRFLAEAAGAFVWTDVCSGVMPGLRKMLAADAGTRTAFQFHAAGGPAMEFPEVARERIAIASYPFREFIAGREEKADGGGKMELKEFAAHVGAKFNIKKIEPWSAHFRSLEKAYLEELRAAVAKAGGAIVNMAVDGEHSPYAMDSA